ncbi:NADPH dehydrogenase NamA [Listeria sp. FSL L7-1485]|uniref:NADPH dehydrogenase n=1 Tax=Listeria immobilis TaxID=2713502 RepID=A0A7X0X678_9LIST|nr:NADPH dehydrogenase NamA [Listeria immobilis]MBC1482572.1 NADPH dehydrogenase NamA [Listeria immobilis]MBC1488242.1 NADPH dehydrogenase NamA [Listeria immobilis]MBC1507254.1 NADPH dehydrogenase NamA [Listeria immobilis]MBC1509834.1 NADPH dehydrogenase NamA [Listeria immobilis]MBC1535655.1 NADPH dehydrogenase NamA [Listeria immobilis]
MSKLFSEYKLKDVTLKNRVVMSPMCMYSVENKDGIATDFHFAHYVSRAAGGTGLVILEATAVQEVGRISEFDLGLWNDEQVPALKRIVDGLHYHGAKAGIQLAHAGRKAVLPGEIVAPSAIAYDEKSTKPTELTKEAIKEVVADFKRAAYRAKEAGFDVIEIHAAHGYLIHQFLSPITNRREDNYGGPAGNRYKILSDIIKAVKEVWDGPIIVRVSATDYAHGGLQLEDYIPFAKWMKADGVELIDVSTGGLVNVAPPVFPGYQVPFADEIRRGAGIATGALGLITRGEQAEEILCNERADLIIVGRELLRNPYFAKDAAQALGETIEAPKQYSRAWK